MKLPTTPPPKHPSILEGGAPPARYARLPTVLVLYATLTGHTARVAQHLGRALNRAGYLCDVLDVSLFRPEESLNPYAGVILCADVRHGRLDALAQRFARGRAEALGDLPSALFSVGLEAASPKAAARAAAKAHLEAFAAQTGWQPTLAQPVAGLLAYTRQGWLTRRMLRKAAADLGLSVDSSQDHDYTDWSDLDAQALTFAALLPAPPALDD